ncbi:tryptophan synthase subunit alpha [Clostridium tertium]|uniref:Tryptophan synthase alpha chain n=1 Tax=Clostridium tertium TaxID=1559 RepID=A0A6N3EA76_9CLOT
MNRISLELEKIKNEGKKALVPFVTFDNLNKEELAELIVNIRKEGANIVEIGVPFTEPLADGEIIQAAYGEAIKNEIKLKDVFDTVKLVRKESDIPIIIMAYYNIIYCYGIEKFLDLSREIGVDGLIIPDLPLEERVETLNLCKDKNIALIPLVAPTSRERIKAISETADGFVYCISSKGITGERNKIINDETIDYLKEVRGYTKLPLLVGFGISNVETAKNIKDYSDGIIVGSAIVKRLRNRDNVLEFIRDLRNALDS